MWKSKCNFRYSRISSVKSISYCDWTKSYKGENRKIDHRHQQRKAHRWSGGKSHANFLKIGQWLSFIWNCLGLDRGDTKSDRWVFIRTKKKEVQAKARKSNFTVVLFNESRTKNMRVARSVHWTVQEPALDKKLVAKVPEYFIKAYPCEETQKYQIYNNA